jgi:hypothetical protein
LTYQRLQLNIVSENIGLKKCISNKKCENELLIPEENKMKKAFCVLLGFQLIVSGCSEHISAHCLNHSDEISFPPDMRENYHPTLTPITDVAGECYCHVEDAAIVTVMAPVIVAFYGIVLIANVGGGEAIVYGLDALVN